jgi:hypothetical protein
VGGGLMLTGWPIGLLETSSTNPAVRKPINIPNNSACHDFTGFTLPKKQTYLTAAMKV